jgi:hypothetical protein
MRLIGDLTLHGGMKEVALDVTLEGMQPHQPRCGRCQLALLTGPAILLREPPELRPTS